jgi:hypothetical protein
MHKFTALEIEDIKSGQALTKSMNVCQFMVQEVYPTYQFFLLFGSRRRGDAKVSSDYDMIVIDEKQNRAEKKVIFHNGDKFDVIASSLPTLKLILEMDANKGNLSLARCVIESIASQEHSAVDGLRALAAKIVGVDSLPFNRSHFKMVLKKGLKRLNETSDLASAIIIGNELVTALIHIELFRHGVGIADGYYADKKMKEINPSFRDELSKAQVSLFIKGNCEVFNGMVNRAIADLSKDLLMMKGG